MASTAPGAGDRPAEALLVGLFPTGTSEIDRYVDLLTSIGVERGLLGPREAPRIWQRHILNCAVLAPAFDAGVTVCDLGSGAGLPGVVLALARPDLQVTLLEPLLRRATFLQEVVAALGLPQVTVVRGRAEDVAGTLRAQVVTARAVAPLDRLAGWAWPLLVPGGELMALKGEGAAAELAASRQALKQLRARAVRIESFGAGVVDPPTRVVRLESPS